MCFSCELFKGTISREWFTTKPKPLQNRFKEMLINARGAINTDGQVRLKPQHEGLAQLIEGFEQALKEQKSVNLGDMFHSLIQPPWGFNIASAGLVLGIFLCARLDNTALIFKGQHVAAAVRRPFTGISRGFWRMKKPAASENGWPVCSLPAIQLR